MNNFDNTPEEVSEGVLEVIKEIKERQPEAYIVLPVSIIKQESSLNI